jgi:predicted amidohydrolase YtcJ
MGFSHRLLRLQEENQDLDYAIGSLEIGKEADIAVWDRDMYSMPAQELRNLKCTMTLLHGRVVFESNHP